jgi:hypothetical protein
MKMELTGLYETSVYKIRTSGNHQKRKNTTFRTRRKFETKHKKLLNEASRSSWHSCRRLSNCHSVQCCTWYVHAHVTQRQFDTPSVCVYSLSALLKVQSVKQLYKCHSVPVCTHLNVVQKDCNGWTVCIHHQSRMTA